MNSPKIMALAAVGIRAPTSFRNNPVHSGLLLLKDTIGTSPDGSDRETYTGVRDERREGMARDRRPKPTVASGYQYHQHSGQAPRATCHHSANQPGDHARATWLGQTRRCISGPGSQRAEGCADEGLRHELAVVVVAGAAEARQLSTPAKAASELLQRWGTSCAGRHIEDEPEAAPCLQAAPAADW
jgi:hypothetical protein